MINLTGHIFDQKKWRIAALLVFIVFGGGIGLTVLNWCVGFRYGDNSGISVVAHVVGTMLWGAACATVIRIARV